MSSFSLQLNVDGQNLLLVGAVFHINTTNEVNTQSLQPSQTAPHCGQLHAAPGRPNLSVYNTLQHAPPNNENTYQTLSRVPCGSQQQAHPDHHGASQSEIPEAEAGATAAYVEASALSPTSAAVASISSPNHFGFTGQQQQKPHHQGVRPLPSLPRSILKSPDRKNRWQTE